MYVLLLLVSLYITGEKARVALAIFALVPRNLLLLDEVRPPHYTISLRTRILAQFCVCMCFDTSCNTVHLPYSLPVV
jgi:hypothetical protein